MCDMLHDYQALAAAELWYGGPHAPCQESRCVPRGPSQIPSDFEYLTYPKQMDKDDIRAVQKMYVDAARRARSAGFDIVYVYGSHSYLPQQFLTPYYNKRTDEYGGSFENRARFWREPIERVKEAGGHDPSIADPWLPRKIDEGRLDDIRECIGCNICISRWEIGGPPVICTQNATAGEEYRRGWHPERFTRARNADNDVLVVGAGPAGMECAMVLGKRGMRRVHLVEAQDDMGGIMRWIPQLPGLGEWARVVNYRKIQIAKLKNVEFIPNTRLDANAVKDYGAEIVIIATGAHWATDGLNGATHDTIPGAHASLPWQLTPEQIMGEGKKAPGKRVLVADIDGYFMGGSLDEKLALEGKQVTLMTHLAHIAPYMDFTLEAPNMHRKLHKLGVELVTHHVPTRLEEGKVVATYVYDEDGHDKVWEVDAVVLVTQRRSDEALYRELKDKVGLPALAAEGVKAFYRIGDCVAPRLIADAIFDGHRLAREIDSPNPEEPLPFKRERRVLDAEIVRREVRERQAALQGVVPV